jgi:hypothetical protein
VHGARSGSNGREFKISTKPKKISPGFPIGNIKKLINSSKGSEERQISG